MKRGITQSVAVRCRGANMTEWSEALLCIRQKRVYFEYPIEIIDDENGKAIIPKEDAMEFRPGICKMQMLYTLEDGTSQVTATKNILVEEILRRDGYGE